MSTRHSTRASRPTIKALESSSASPPNTTGTGRATRAPRSTTRSATTDTRNEEESPVAKRRKVSPEKSDANGGRGSRAGGRKKATVDKNTEEDEEPTDVDETPRPKRPGRRAAASARKKPSDEELEEESITISRPPRPKLVAGAPQKITNLYGGRRKHVDRDDTPSSVGGSFNAGGSFTAGEASPSKSIRKRRTASQPQGNGAGTGDEGAPDGVDKFRRGRHGSVKKKVTPIVQEASKPTITVNVVEYGGPTKKATASPAKRRGRKPATKPDDTDLEGDVIMADSDASPTKAGGKLASRSAGGKARGAAQKKDDEGSVFDLPGSDEEDPFAKKIKSAKKTPSKLTANLRRVKIAKDLEEGGNESRGFEAEDEKENEEGGTVEEEIIDVQKEAKAIPKFQGRVTDDAVKTLKSHVMSKITGRGLPESLVGLKDEYNTVYQLVEQTVAAGEGNSILLIGPRGSGKSLVAEKAIATLQKHFEKDFIVVRLSGSLQTDEKTAVKEIWRQLGSSMELDESKPINFADTLTTILALLSHPSEHDPTASQESAAETTSISVIFLLSEFEQFAAHPRQTLLYNLFDIAQARKAPIAVVGMTSKINIVEDLEKRVKSRFSHRTLGFRTGGAQGSRLDGWWEIAKAGLSVDIDTLPIDTSKNDMAYYSQWNASLDDAFKHDKAFRRTVEGVYSTSKSIQVLYNHLMVSICSISPAMPFLGAGSALTKHALGAPDNKLYLLEDLPELSLAMLIAAARLDPILETDTCNFTMAYDEYKTLVSRVKIYSQTTWGLKLWGKDVALAAWERLAEWELIVPVVGASAYGGGIGVTASLLVGSGNTGVGRRESRMFRVDVGLMEIKRQGRAWGMGSILQGWCTI